MKKTSITNILFSLLGAIFGAIGFYFISLHFDNKIPLTVSELETEAYSHLWRKEYNKSRKLYTKALSIDATRVKLWEGLAYSHMGLIIGDDFHIGNLGFSANVDSWKTHCKYKTHVLLNIAYMTASHAKTNGEKAVSEYLIGLVLELSGNENVSPKYGDKPLSHYYRAALLIEDIRIHGDLLKDINATERHDYILPWLLPWQVHTITQIAEYPIAVRYGIIREITSSHHKYYRETLLQFFSEDITNEYLADIERFMQYKKQ